METTQTQTTGSSARTGAGWSITTEDGIELPLYRWQPVSAPRATVALVHGLAEHAQRYAALAGRLNAAGIELLAIDLRGHGRAPGERAFIERFDDYLRDCAALVDAAGKVAAQNGTPLFLMGHSMGGAIAALYAVERTSSDAAASSGEPSGKSFIGSAGVPFAGLILSSPALAPGHDVPRWMLALSQFISRVWPRFPAMKIDATLLSRDPAVVDANRNDPLVHHGAVPARTGAEILLAMQRIEQGRASLRVPVLVYHGTRDRLTEPDGSRAFGATAGSPDKTLTLYEGAFHETMNDLDSDHVIDALVKWILQRAR